MKTIFQTVFLCLLFSLNGFTQLVDVNNSWNYLEVLIPTCEESTQCSGKFYQNYQYTFGNDTIINNQKYLALFESIRNTLDATVSYTYRLGFLRDEENHKKVYFLPERYPGPEVLLYDFTLKKSDIFTFTFSSAKVLKTDSITTNGTKRLRIQFDEINSNWVRDNPIADTLEWIEGIGERQGLIYKYWRNLDLLCFKHNNDTEYMNNYGLDCLYTGPPNFVESIKRNDIKVYPNPVKNILTIQSEKPIQTIALYRLTGEKIDQYYPDDTFYQIALKNQNSGIYILSIDGNFRKIIME
jgi:hypothetical protein